jgi:O-antigen ligase
VKEQLGEGNWAQKKLIDALAGRTPEEARRMMRNWRLGTLILTLALAGLALLLLTWSTAAGLAVAVLAALAFALWWRLQKQRADLEALADMLNGKRRR